MSSFCVHCQRKTGNLNPHMAIAKNGRAMIRSICSVCHHQKSEFVKNSAARSAKRPRGKKSGAGLLDLIGGIF